MKGSKGDEIRVKQEITDLSNDLIEKRKREARSQSRPTRVRLQNQIQTSS